MDTDFKIYLKGNDHIIERLVFPRFKAKITFDTLSDLSDIEMIDNCTDVMILARAMREAGYYLVNHSK